MSEVKSEGPMSIGVEVECAYVGERSIKNVGNQMEIDFVIESGGYSTENGAGNGNSSGTITIVADASGIAGWALKRMLYPSRKYVISIKEHEPLLQAGTLNAT